MNKQEALSIINCDDLFEAEDAFGFEVFELKKKLLLVLPPIKIMQSLIKRFNRLQLVNETLNINENLIKTDEVTINFNHLSMVEILIDYHKLLSKLKLNISKNNQPKIIIQQINALIKLQTNLYFILSDFVKIKPKTEEYDTIKLSEPIKTFQLQQEIMNLTFHGKELSDYISKNKDTYFYKCILIANKQIEYNGLRREI
jgi:hypothetical protein